MDSQKDHLYDFYTTSKDKEKKEKEERKRINMTSYTAEPLVDAQLD